MYLGFTPRIATERIDSGENRLEKICELIQSSKYSIHDLSRLKAKTEGEFYRLNMPFELGIDFGCRRYFGRKWKNKKILVLEENRFQYQAAISDLAGYDIKSHNGDFAIAMRNVRNWLASESNSSIDGAQRIIDKYTDFQEWHYEKQRDNGFSEKDIQDYPTNELLSAMISWLAKD